MGVPSCCWLCQMRKKIGTPSYRGRWENWIATCLHPTPVPTYDAFLWHSRLTCNWVCRVVTHERQKTSRTGVDITNHFLFLSPPFDVSYQLHEMLALVARGVSVINSARGTTLPHLFCVLGWAATCPGGGSYRTLIKAAPPPRCWGIDSVGRETKRHLNFGPAFKLIKRSSILVSCWHWWISLKALKRSWSTNPDLAHEPWQNFDRSVAYILWGRRDSLLKTDATLCNCVWEWWWAAFFDYLYFFPSLFALCNSFTLPSQNWRITPLTLVLFFVSKKWMNK